MLTNKRNERKTINGYWFTLNGYCLYPLMDIVFTRCCTKKYGK